MENNGRFLQQQQQQQLAFQQQAFAPLAQQMLANPSFVGVSINFVMFNCVEFALILGEFFMKKEKCHSEE